MLFEGDDCTASGAQPAFWWFLTVCRFFSYINQLSSRLQQPRVITGRFRQCLTCQLVCTCSSLHERYKASVPRLKVSKRSFYSVDL
jgi:hypothetical protein